MVRQHRNLATIASISTQLVQFRRSEACKPESLFWFKNYTNHTPIPLFADGVNNFIRTAPKRSAIRTHTAEIT
jgi:hypothetical protein